MKLRPFGKVFDAVLFVMFLVCLGLTYRACRERPVEVTSPAVMETPTPAPTPTPPEPVDPNPERTLILTAMTCSTLPIRSLPARYSIRLAKHFAGDLAAMTPANTKM